MMDWDEGDGLNEDGLFDAAPSQDCEAMLSSERDERLENVSSTSRNRAPEAGTPTLYYTVREPPLSLFPSFVSLTGDSLAIVTLHQVSMVSG